MVSRTSGQTILVASPHILTGHILTEGLAPLAAGLAVGPVHLPHQLALGGQEPDQPSAVTPSPLHAPGLHLAQTLGPGQHRPIAPRRGRNPGRGQMAAELVQGAGDMKVAVGIDPDGDPARLGGCAMVVMAVSLPDKGRWLRRPSGRTTLRRVCGDRLLTC